MHSHADDTVHPLASHYSVHPPETRKTVLATSHEIRNLRPSRHVADVRIAPTVGCYRPSDAHGSLRSYGYNGKSGTRRGGSGHTNSTDTPTLHQSSWTGALVGNAALPGARPSPPPAMVYHGYHSRIPD